MNHRGGVLSVESAALEQFDLAAAAFFRGSTDDRQCQTEVVDDRCQCERRADGDRRDEVVSAGVSESRQCVVFGAECDVEVASSDCRGERGREVAELLDDREAAVGEWAGHPSCRIDFLPGGLGVVVQVVRERDQTRVRRRDTAAEFGVESIGGGVDGGHRSPGTP